MPFDPSAARSSTIFSDNPDYAVAWICYINGIEVPIVGFNLNYGVWQIPQFQIHMLPDVQLQRLGSEDRVQVAIFYLDYWVDPRKPEFRLLCDGEIIGWNWSNVTGQRTLSFQCIAHAQIFQQLYFFYMTNVDDIVAAQDPVIRSTGLATPGTGLLYPYALFHQGLVISDSELNEINRPRTGGTPSNPGTGTAQAPTGDDDTGEAARATAPIQAPYELVYNVIKGIISKQVPDARRALPMMNFFARWVRTTRFHNRWVRLPIFEDPDVLANRQGCFPIFNAARNDTALLAMQHMSSQIANSGPIWNTIQQLLNYVYMEVAMIPNPACVRVTLGSVASAVSPTDGTTGASPPTLAELANEAASRLTPAQIFQLAEQTSVAQANPGQQDRLRAAFQTLTRVRTAQAATPADTAQQARTVAIQNVRNILGGSSPIVQQVQQALDRLFQPAVTTAAATNPTGTNTTPTPSSPTTVGTASEVGPSDGMILGLLENTTALIEQRPRNSTGRDTFEERAHQIADQIRTALRSNVSIDPQVIADAGLTSTPTTAEDVSEADITAALRRQNALFQQGVETGPPDAPAPHAEVGVDPRQPIRLAQYFVKPQFLFGIPPHCNVVFPSMMDAWSGDENYINQVTRIYINDAVMTRLLRADHGTNHHFMLHALTVGWPQEAGDLMHHHVAGSGQGDGQAAAAGARDSGRNLLIWPEEYYKGPVTGRLEMSSWLQSLLQFRNANANSNNDLDPPSSQSNSPRPATNDVNAQISPTAPVPIIPGSTTPQTTTAAVTVAGTDQAPTTGTGQGALTYGRRILVGRETRISLNGAPEMRFWMGQFTRTLERTDTRGRVVGTSQLLQNGLAPEKWLPPRKTQLWPFPVQPTDARRRGRQPRRTSDTPLVEKINITLHLLMEAVQNSLGSSLTRDQLFAITFGFFWNAFTEGAVDHMLTWGFGNQKQYSSSAYGFWTINPTDRQPYVAAENPRDGAQRFVSKNVNNFTEPVQILTGRPPSSPRLRQFFQEHFTAEETAFWSRVAPIRPDFFYPALGFYKYYDSERDLNDGNDDLRRAAVGLRNIAGMKARFRQQFDYAKQHPVSDFREFYAEVPHRSLVTAEDLAFLRNQANNVSPNARVVSRPTRRIMVNNVAPETAGGGTNVAGSQGPGVTRTTVDNTTGTAQTNSPTAPTTHETATDAVENEDEQAAEPFAKMFQIYAQYEFFRQRYYQRQAGAQLRFNPYLVPGFPSIVFDSMTHRFHCVGYIQTINHAGMATPNPTLGTSFSLVAVRTFPEFMNDVRNDAELFATRVTSAPAEVVDEIRGIIQDETQAEIFYQRLFHGGARPNSLPAAFHWTQAVGYARGVGVIPISITGESVADTVARDRAIANAAATQGTDEEVGVENTQRNPTSGTASAQVGGVSSEGQRTVEHNIDPNEALSPLPNIYQDCFDNYHIAMQMCARPICTLNEYIRFLHAGQTIGDLMSKDPPIVEGELHDYSYAKVQETDVVALGTNPDGSRRAVRGVSERQPAVYYRRIYRLRPGPGPEGSLRPPSVEERGYGNGPPFTPSPISRGVPETYPQTRQSWDDVLVAYANKVRLLLRPST